MIKIEREKRERDIEREKHREKDLRVREKLREER